MVKLNKSLKKELTSTIKVNIKKFYRTNMIKSTYKDKVYENIKIDNIMKERGFDKKNDVYFKAREEIVYKEIIYV